MEIWKDIPGFEGLYQLSSFGRVKSFPRETTRGGIMAVGIGTTGYYYVKLTKNGKRKHLRIHRSLAELFIPNPENKPCINHKDGNKLNNSFDNLEWCTSSENNFHGYRTGLIPRNRDKIKKPVIQLDRFGIIVKIWPSATDVQKQLGINAPTISKCCNKRGANKTAGGFFWEYEKENRL